MVGFIKVVIPTRYSEIQGFMTHFGDISYNVFNRRIPLIFKLDTSNFRTYCREVQIAKKIFKSELYFEKFPICRKNLLRGLGVTEYRTSILRSELKNTLFDPVGRECMKCYFHDYPVKNTCSIRSTTFRLSVIIPHLLL